MVSSVCGELAMDSGTRKKANVSMEGVSKHFSGAMIHDMRQLSQRPNVLPANYDHFSFFSSASKTSWTMFRIMQAHARARKEGRELRWLVVDVFGGGGVKTGRRSEGQGGVAAEGQRGEHLVQMSCW